MNFIKYLTNVQDILKIQKNQLKKLGKEKYILLSETCHSILGKHLCLNEQISNWENRPLRKSQQHYAAMDVWVLIELAQKILPNLLNNYDSKDGSDINK